MAQEPEGVNEMDTMDEMSAMAMEEVAGTDEGVRPPMTDEGVRPPMTDEGVRPPTTDEGVRPPTTDEGVRPPTTDEGEAEEASDEVVLDLDEDERMIIEGLIFASDEPIPFKQIRDILYPSGEEESAVDAEAAAIDAERDAAMEAGEAPAPRRPAISGRKAFTVNRLQAQITALNAQYASGGRAFRITEIAGGFTFQTTGSVGGYVGRMFAERTKRRLTQSALETLAIISFRQPISKPAIEAIRGVNADYVLKSLLDRNLIAIVGRDNSVGRPLLYGTTKTFLKHFGLNSLEDLPKPREIADLLAEENELAARSIEERDDLPALTDGESVSIFDTVRAEGVMLDGEPVDVSENPPAEVDGLDIALDVEVDLGARAVPQTEGHKSGHAADTSGAQEERDEPTIDVVLEEPIDFEDELADEDDDEADAEDAHDTTNEEVMDEDGLDDDETDEEDLDEDGLDDDEADEEDLDEDGLDDDETDEEDLDEDGLDDDETDEEDLDEDGLDDEDGGRVGTAQVDDTGNAPGIAASIDPDLGSR